MSLDLENLKVPEDLPAGDMPGEHVKIAEGHIKKAGTIFPLLMEKIDHAMKDGSDGKIVVSICGGSGAGKSGIASVLSYLLNEAGLGSYVMSGDNYPKRIPAANDNERLHIFRQGGIRALKDAGILTPEIVSILQELQRDNMDAEPTLSTEYEWFGQYIVNASGALKDYLGSPDEQDYEEVNSILSSFKKGADELWLKRMGRDEASLWYDRVDMRDKKILILEWTHGNSEYLRGVDISILLASTPQETLSYRLERGRDHGIDSPFTTIVLNLEQAILDSQASRASIILTKSGNITSHEDYMKML